MDRYTQEWQRLYAVPGGAADGADLVGAQGQVRALVLELARPADWSLIGALWRGVQADLDWPAPAIAVNGRDGYQLWFSLAQPVAPAQGRALLHALVQRYLPEVPPGRLGLWPQGAAPAVEHAPPVPRAMPDGERWSAFVAPDLAAVFGDEAALDLPPGADAQADVLARLAPLQPGQWAPLLSMAAEAPRAAPVADATDGPAALGEHTGPRPFLLAVMNDASVPMALRIEAAKALLAAGG
ncbi:hypothetical protein [Hydrogenophaga electricum]|uniref:DUF4123 domain-containing protein n=1 Tax=Hydrogenophaga electricum TaxID=1230953 RepID=A0ABQ6BZ05_9BURK|nr:hypothetical protein [Hydrogenophaga electricum]GLS13217.1 hypothetical protein GCM10007935_06460 [Hydrogenophaga electricum]